MGNQTARDLLRFYVPMKVVGATFIVAGENPPPLALNDNHDNPMIMFNRHLFKMDTSVKWTPRVGPCLSLLPLFDSLQNGHLCKMDT